MDTLEMAPEEVTVRDLVIADRCDRCGAQAFIIASKGDYELLFCLHEGNKHMEKLKESGFDIMDQSGRLLDTP
jgi:hypothetical protein